MEKQQLLNADYLDIVYDNRNKQYGGYELRRNYQSRARKATAVVVLAAGLLSSIPVIAGLLEGGKKNDVVLQKETVITIANTEPLKRPEPVKPRVTKPAAAAPKVATVAVPPLKIVENNQVPADAPKPVDSLGDRVAGRNNNAGEANGLVADNGQASGTSTRPSEGDGPVGPSGPLSITQISQMPEFNGDVAAYLSSHLRYPEQAREAGQTGRTVIQFVINEDGAITNTEVARTSKVPSLDAEALRVVSSMPKWKPGKQQGKAVKVYFNLPIGFELE